MATTNGNKKVVRWICRKCGRKTMASSKPGALCGGKCKASPAGAHSYVKA
ncbi:MAG: hypothetical protein J1E62_09295 [Lachnospiraceae bacterium]|nr:hypothetical protein [Lachnospiraceae bacterium]